MYCPFCRRQSKNFDTKVTDSRWVPETNQIRRRRECPDCHRRFTSYERAELFLPHVIKRHGERQPFDEERVRRGFVKALEKRPIEMAAINQAVDDLQEHLRALGEREVSSSIIGEWIMQRLKALDKVAYVRFASVYRSFEDVEEFQSAIEQLLSQVKASEKDKA